ncbi:MAG: hypothetical protein PVF37_04965 [Desulfobacterales bacterium]|jgi:heparanase 1
MYILSKPIVSRILKSNFIQFAAELFYPSSPKFSKPTGDPVKISINREAKVSEIDEKFLSFAVDSSQVVGGHWWSPTAEVEGGLGRNRTRPYDFSRRRLHLLTRELSPAYLRIGGTEADAIYYDMTGSGSESPPPPYELVLTRRMWDDVNSFAQSTGCSIFFTVNAGPATRKKDQSWTTKNAARLLEYTELKNYPVAVWEFGNEINAFWFQFGRRNQVTARQYAKDFDLFKKLVKTYQPRSRVAGPACIFWPLMGEPLSFWYAFYLDFLKAAGSRANIMTRSDIITWHFYPQQSRRCGFAIRPATPNQLLNPDQLDEVQRWAKYVEDGRNDFAPQAEVWLGEVGNAQCGGEPGVSDTYVAGIWWLDLLGAMARRGQQAVIRQTLCGSDYALIDELTLEPNPDYWNCLIWKRLMGSRTLKIRMSADNAYVRAYAHYTKNKSGSITLLLLNVHEHQSAKVLLENIRIPQEATIYRFSARRLTGKELFLNGKLIKLDGDRIPSMAGKPVTLMPGKSITIAPASYIFVVLPIA